MRAAWYDRQGAAADVLTVGDIPDPVPERGEVRVRLTYSGINPGDTKKRRGWLGSTMEFARVVPHSDGAGVIDLVGDDGGRGRLGERVWVWGAQSYRPDGTAAEYVVVPSDHAVRSPESVSDVLGACLGIPGITAHRSVFADGPVAGRTVLVNGALGAVGSIAAQLALRGGASVVSTVRRTSDLDALPDRLRATAVALDVDDPARAVRAVAPDGIDRVVEVAFSANAALDDAVLRDGGVVAAYGTKDDPAPFPFWSMLFKNTVIRLLGSDDFPESAKVEAAMELTAAAADGDLDVPIGEPFSLDAIAEAHDAVDHGTRRRVLLRIDGA